MSAGRRPRPSATLFTVAGPTLLAAALVLWHLGTRSLWLDEGATVAIVSQHGSGLWQAMARDGGNMLGYYVVIHLVSLVFGVGQVAIRLPSALSVIGTVALTVVGGLRLFGSRRAAAGAGVLVAVSLPIVFWGQDARGYAPMVCFATWSVLFCCEVLSVPAGEPVPRRLLIAYGLSLLISLYLGFIAILLVFPEVLIVALFPALRARWRELGVVLAGVGLACLPLLLLALGRGSSQLFWVPSPNLTVLKQAAVTLTSTGMPPNFHGRSTTTLFLILSGAVIVGAVGLAVARSRGRAARDWRVALVAAWFVVPAVLGLLASEVGEPVELARGSVLLIPAVALLIGWAAFCGGPARVSALVGWAVVIGLMVVRLIPLLPSYSATPENWERAAAYVAASAAAPPGGGCVAFYPEDGRMAFDYYVGAAAGGELRPVLPALPWRETRPFVERYVVPTMPRLTSIVRDCPRLWLIASHDGQRSGPPVSRENYRRYQALVAYFNAHYPSDERRLFGYAAVIRVETFSR